MLTGESIPVMKAGLPLASEEIFCDKDCSSFILYGGTTVIQTRPLGDEPVLAMVKCTGFMTAKGGLIRDILYPKEISFKFYTDAAKVSLMMVVLGIVSFFITLPIMLSQDFNERYLISSCLELVTTCVPPALPAVLACGIVFALDRLKKYKIYCIAPPRINLAGTV
jgi:cation-transporting ATPase 13A3/4/5